MCRVYLVRTSLCQRGDHFCQGKSSPCSKQRDYKSWKQEKKVRKREKRKKKKKKKKKPQCSKNKIDASTTQNIQNPTCTFELAISLFPPLPLHPSPSSFPFLLLNWKKCKEQQANRRAHREQKRCWEQRDQPPQKLGCSRGWRNEQQDPFGQEKEQQKRERERKRKRDNSFSALLWRKTKQPNRRRITQNQGIC